MLKWKTKWYQRYFAASIAGVLINFFSDFYTLLPHEGKFVYTVSGNRQWLALLILLQLSLLFKALVAAGLRFFHKATFYAPLCSIPAPRGQYSKVVTEWVQAMASLYCKPMK